MCKVAWLSECVEGLALRIVKDDELFGLDVLNIGAVLCTDLFIVGLPLHDRNICLRERLELLRLGRCGNKKYESEEEVSHRFKCGRVDLGN